MGSDDGVADAILLVPAGHSVAERHTDSLDPIVRVPDAQVEHRRSDTAEGGLATYEPAEQTLHGVQVTLLLAPLNVPVGHGVQVRSAMAEPEIPTKVPGAQSVKGLQALPERKVPSLHVGRHVPSAQVAGSRYPASR
jgi:hypothetical protein